MLVDAGDGRYAVHVSVTLVLQHSMPTFDTWYRNHRDYYSQPSDGLQKCIDAYAVLPCRALDLGCGQGRNSLWLASLGFDVLGIDISESAIAALETSARGMGVRVNTRTADITTTDIGIALFGLVVIQTTLNHLDVSGIQAVCERVTQSLVPDGLLYCVGFTTADPGSSGKEIASECARFVKHYFASNELRRLFPSMTKVLLYEEYQKLDDSHGPAHLHGKVKLIARR